MRLLQFLNNTSLFVSIGALFTYVFGVLITHEQIIVTHAPNSFFLTWCAYQFIKPIHSKFRKAFMLIACTGACLNACFLPLHFIIPVIIGIVLTLFYKNDWRGKEPDKVQFSLRKNGWLKSIATALAWTLVTSWWMIIRLVEEDQNGIIVLVVLSQFFWIGALALAGDLRDIDLEREERRTLPSQWGVMTTRIVCSVLFVISALLVMTFMAGQNSFETTDILLIGSIYLIALVVIWRLAGHHNWHRITIVLDGLLVLKAIGAFLCLMA